MKIQFEIKEKLPEIIAEIMHSDKWQTKILEKMHGLERITIKDPNYKDRKSTRLNSSHRCTYRMPSSA